MNLDCSVDSGGFKRPGKETNYLYDHEIYFHHITDILAYQIA